MNVFIELIRYMIITLFSIGNSVLCSSLVVEIAKQNDINWRVAYKTSSFKYLAISVSIMVILFIADYKARAKSYERLQDVSINALISSNIYSLLIDEMKVAVRTCNTEKFDTLDSFRTKLNGWGK